MLNEIWRRIQLSNDCTIGNSTLMQYNFCFVMSEIDYSNDNKDAFKFVIVI